MVPNTSELLPEPETPVNTVSRRFGSSTLTSLRLFTRAPCTRIRSWLSATCSAGDCVSVLVALLIVSPSVGRGRLRALRRRRLARSDQLRTVRLAARSPRAKPGCGAGRYGTSGTAWPAHAGRSRCARRTGHPAPAAARRSRGPRLRDDADNRRLLVRPKCRPTSARAGGRHSSVLKQPEDVGLRGGDRC